jgi:hypothetical protein
MTNDKYSNYLFNDVRDQLISSLEAKEGPKADTSSASYSRSLLELFSANTDMNTYWINKGFQEVARETL